MSDKSFKPIKEGGYWVVQATNPQSPQMYTMTWRKRKYHYSKDGRVTLCNQVVAGKVEDDYNSEMNMKYGLCKNCEANK